MIHADNIVLGYSGRSLNEAVSFDIPDGKCFLLAGPNGCGKTTLLRAIAGLEKPLSGYFGNCNAILVPSRIPKVAGFSVLDFVNLSQGSGTKALSLLGMDHMVERDLTTLSDGEFQRVCIASALAPLLINESDKCSMSVAEAVLLLDEPTAFLDVEGKTEIVSLLSSISHKLGITVLFSSHDIHIAAQHVDGVVLFDSLTKQINVKYGAYDDINSFLYHRLFHILANST